MFVDRTANRGEQKPSIVMHDRDKKFTQDFVTTLKKGDVRTNALPIASPNLNGRTERFVKSIREECLEMFILFGKQHLDYLVGCYVDYYNRKRSHTEREHLPPIREEPEEVKSLSRDNIVVESYVGGLIKSFERKAA